MSMWIYPIGAKVNGDILEERAVRPALPFSDPQGDQHDSGVFVSWSLEELAAVGVKLFLEDTVSDGYWPGVPQDIEDPISVRRTYPNPVPIPGYFEAKRRTAIIIELAALDTFVPRSVEEMYQAMGAALGLSQMNIDRIAKKAALRAELATLNA